MTNIKQKAREMFDAEKWTHWHTRCSQFVEIPNSLKDKFKDFLDRIIDLAIAEERNRLLEGVLVDMSALNMFTADDMAYIHKIIKNRFNNNK